MASDSLCSVDWLHLSTAVTWKTVGIARANEASVSVVVEVRAAVLLKRCSRNFVPPARIDAPITSRTLPMIEPVIDAFTTPGQPFGECHQCDDQLCCVTEGGIQQSSDSMAEMFRELLGCTPHPACQRHNPKAGANEQGGLVPKTVARPAALPLPDKSQQPVKRGL